MEMIQIKDTILSFLSVGAIGILVYEIRMVRQSVESLNIKVAVVMGEISHHRTEIERHHYRLERLETDDNIN